MIDPSRFLVALGGSGCAVRMGVVEPDDLVGASSGGPNGLEERPPVDLVSPTAVALGDVVRGDDALHTRPVSVSSADEDAAALVGEFSLRLPCERFKDVVADV